MSGALSDRESPPARRSWFRRALKGLGIFSLLLLVALALGLVWARSRVKASLPVLDGERSVRGLSAEAVVERDELGVPRIRGGSRADVTRALGFLHAQDRFFQMDLTRRQAAGEFAEIFGPAVLPMDRKMRHHRFRVIAGQVLAQLTPAERSLLEAYAEGVNAGLASLDAPPFEYLALRAEPLPWKPEDSVLVILTMFCELQSEENNHEAALGLLHDTLPPALADFLAPAGTEFDAPLAGEPFPVKVPGPEVLDLRLAPAPAAKAAAARPASPLRRFERPEMAGVVGSNNWAVAGSHTASGRGLVANDMHLGLGVPNIWYRASLVWPEGPAGRREVTGATLPGTPLLVVGSNGQVAWGFTNSYGDWGDLILLEPDPRDADAYLTPGGPRKIERLIETIRVKGEDDAAEEVEWTVWGPVLRKDAKGRRVALAWTAHRPQAVNFRFQELDTARNVDEALAVAHRSGIPAQNFVVADASGRIGWTIVGRVPRRVGFDGRRPASWADGSRRWDGWLTPEEMPRVVDPPAGRVWTANSRVVDGDGLAKLGDGGYDFGARSRQIRDGLMAVGQAAPADMLKIQLDDRALFLAPWRDLLLKTLTPAALEGHPRRAELRRLVDKSWDGHASIDSAGYRNVALFKDILADQVFASLAGPCQEVDADLCSRTPQFQGVLWKLVSERPLHLLDPRYKSWDEAILAGVDGMLGFQQELGVPLDMPWGARTTLRARHPLSRAVPFLSRWLDVPSQPLPGDENMPRVQAASFGASERFAVSPGEEEKGYFHMPVGQSGHPMSPYFQAGHEAWVKGEPASFLPGPARHTLKLVPAR